MKSQTLKYGGFYIGRYETGYQEKETGYNTVIKKGVQPCFNVKWGKAMNDVSDPYGAVYLSKMMYENSSSVISTLCYGSQWDAMCRYIGDSQRLPVKQEGGPNKTGNIRDVSKNIYDLAGNCKEWTMEANNYDIYIWRVTRGGCYADSDNIAYRWTLEPDVRTTFTSFRCTLYVKD